MATIMASQPPMLTRTVSGGPRPGRQYTEEEWERVKQPFYHYYIEKNFSLKEAAICIREQHSFDATLRQWERRIAPEKWNFPKYANREERLKSIEAAGKSLLDVSHRGRRKSTGSSDGQSDLLEDRNIRRFARRELSREPSRRRAKSVSGMSEATDHDMSGTSTAAPSPAPSEYFMDTQEESGPFSHNSVNSMNSIWAQDPMIAVPDIRVFDSVPEITFSGPEEASLIAPEPTPIATQSQVNVHYPPADEGSFGAFQPQPNHVFSSSFDGSPNVPPMSMNWNNSDPFAANATTNNSSFPEFDFNSDPTMSFTQMMNLDNPAVPRKVTINSHLDGFNNLDLQLTEPIPTPITPADVESSVEDPTHADVHALLQEHYSTTLQMLSMCMQSCEHATGNNDMVKNVVMKNLKLLEAGIRASSTCERITVEPVLTS